MYTLQVKIPFFYEKIHDFHYDCTYSVFICKRSTGFVLNGNCAYLKVIMYTRLKEVASFIINKPLAKTR